MRVSVFSTSRGLVATPPTVDFRTGLVQTVSITSPQPLSFYETTLREGYVTASDCDISPCQITYRLDINRAPKSADFGHELSIFQPEGLGTIVGIHISLSDVTVTSSPPEVPVSSDSSGAAVSATLRWVNGSTHQLTAPATYQANGSSFVFTSWSDGVTALTRPFTPSADGPITARYNADRPLTLSASPTAGGTFLVNGAPPLATYRDGVALTITAVPSSGYVFKEYTGDAASLSPTLLLTVKGATNLVGTFVPATQPKTTFITNPAALIITVDGKILLESGELPLDTG